MTDTKRLFWRNAGLADSPREEVAKSKDGTFWVLYPASDTRWGLQRIRPDLSEAPPGWPLSFSSRDDAIATAELEEAR